jgi:hypothetical protein
MKDKHRLQMRSSSILRCAEDCPRIQKIGNKGVKYLAEAIKINSILQEITIESNAIHRYDLTSQILKMLQKHFGKGKEFP